MTSDQRALRPRLFPRVVDNEYNGFVFVVWFFAALTVLTAVRSVLHIVLPDGGAQVIATIPLDRFGHSAVQTVIGLFGQWGLSQVLLAAVFVIVLLRYRQLIPLMLLVALVEWVGRSVVGLAKPIGTDGTAPGEVGNIVLAPVIFVVLVLSLLPRRRRADAADDQAA